MEKVIRTAINDVLANWGFTGVNFAVEHPAELTHGDYATNVAMVVASYAWMDRSNHACGSTTVFSFPANLKTLSLSASTFSGRELK